MGSMQSPRDVSSTSGYDSGKVPPSLASDGPRVNSLSQPHSGSRGAPGKPTSGRGFLKGAFWLRRKGHEDPQQDQVTPKSRLCMETSHESPIQAVRKPPAWESSRGFDSDEESVQGNPGGIMLLRKLFCPKAASSRLKKPGVALDKAPPFCRESTRCGPVAALSRTADPQGESPLHWKPRAEVQDTVEAPLAPMVVKEEVNSGRGWWSAKPWRALRALIASGRKGREDASEGERSCRETVEGDFSLPAEPEMPPGGLVDSPTGEPPRSMADQETPLGLLSGQDEADGDAQEDSWPGWESHRKSGTAIRESGETFSCFLSQGESHWAEDPIPEDPSEFSRDLGLSGGFRAGAGEHAVEGQDPGLAALRSWLEIIAGEEEDLGDLAENPGGQGMVMATGDLGWLDREALGGPVFKTGGWKAGQAAELSPGVHTENQEVKGQKAGGGHTGEEEAGRGLQLACGSENDSPEEAPVSVPDDPSGAQCLTSGGPQLHDCTPEPHLPILPGDLEPSTPGLLMSEGSIGCQQEHPAPGLLTLPGGQEEGPGQTELMEARTEQEKHLLYLAAVEIVGAAVDAATEQLAKRPAGAEPGWNRHFP